jgi:hypothetical protein
MVAFRVVRPADTLRFIDFPTLVLLFSMMLIELKNLHVVSVLVLHKTGMAFAIFECDVCAAVIELADGEVRTPATLAFQPVAIGAMGMKDLRPIATSVSRRVEVVARSTIKTNRIRSNPVGVSAIWPKEKEKRCYLILLLGPSGGLI